jgi:cell division protein FtsW (lipid II flippase)
MSISQRVSLSHLGWGLALPVLLLTCVGLLAIHATDRSSSPLAMSEVLGDADWVARFTKAVGPLALKQATYTVAGIALMLATLAVGYQRLGRYSYLGYGILLTLLILLIADKFVDLPLIPVRNNSRRWISLGLLSLQPSEFMKVVLVLTLARYLRFRSSYRRWYGLLPPFVLTLVPMALILEQPDLGTTLMLLPVLFTMLFAAGARLRHLGIIVFLGLASLPVFYVFGMKEYQRERILVMLKQNV